MFESFRRKEQGKHYWVPFREADIVSSSRAEYGQVFWNPAFIPHGKNILIDVAGVNNWLKSLSIGFPLEIKPYHPKNEDIQVSGVEVNQRGEAALSSSRFKSKVPKPKLAMFLGDLETNSQTILVNFSGISDYIKKRNPSISNNDFDREYGLMVDKALKSQTTKLIIFNYLNIMKDNPYMAAEFVTVLLGSLAAFGTELSSLASLSANGSLNVETATASTIISGSFFLLAHLISTTGTFLLEAGKTDDKKGLDKSLRRLYYEYLCKIDGDFPWKSIFPIQFTRYFSGPLLKSLFKRPLVKGNE